MIRTILSLITIPCLSVLTFAQVKTDQTASRPLAAQTQGLSIPSDELWLNPQKTFDERKALFLDYSSANAPKSGRTGIFAQVARLAKGLALDDAVLKSALEFVYSNADCNDFTLGGLLRIMYLYQNTNLMSPEQKRDIERCLIDFNYWYDEPGSDGRCYWTENHQIIFHSNIAGRIRSNIENNPKVCLEASELGKMLPSNVALEFSLQFRSVVVFGTARLVIEPEEARRVLYGLIQKYFPLMTPGQEFREITDKELRSTSVYAIQIETWSGKENWKDRADQSKEWTPLEEKWFE